MKVYLQTSLAEVQSPGTYQLGAANGVPCLVARVALWAGWWCARCRANYAARRCYCLLSTVTVLFCEDTDTRYCCCWWGWGWTGNVVLN